MNALVLLFLMLPLGAQAPFRIISVDRRGAPPYEPATRIYRLDGGEDRGMRVGERLTVGRLGATKPLGHLRVLVVGAHHAESTFTPAGVEWPMKGDPVWRDELPGLPGWGNLNGEPLPELLAPASRVLAPPQEGMLLFLPQRAELSPAGRTKVEAWVQAWGVSGRWVVQTPLGKTLQPELQQQRAEALSALLKQLGVLRVDRLQGVRSYEGPYEPLWILHRE